MNKNVMIHAQRGVGSFGKKKSILFKGMMEETVLGLALKERERGKEREKQRGRRG